MQELRPADESGPAAWLLTADVDWWELVRYGPAGFETYLRVAFAVDDDRPGAQVDTVREAFRVLAGHTTTPDACYAAIWEGWTSAGTPPQAPRVVIPHRTMLLVMGHVDALRDAPSLVWHGTTGDAAPPHLAWPEDHAWCLACEVDEEIEFTVGCSARTADALRRRLAGRVREVRYGEPTPLYGVPD